MSRLRLVGKCLGVSYLLLALAVLGKRHREDNSVHNRLSSALGRCGGRSADVNSLRDLLSSLLDHYVSTWIYRSPSVGGSTNTSHLGRGMRFDTRVSDWDCPRLSQFNLG
jgi:hypothetical protein